MIEVKLYCLSMMQAVITVARYLVCVCFSFFSLSFFLVVSVWVTEREEEREKDELEKDNHKLYFN